MSTKRRPFDQMATKQCYSCGSPVSKSEARVILDSQSTLLDAVGSEDTPEHHEILDRYCEVVNLVHCTPTEQQQLDGQPITCLHCHTEATRHAYRVG